MAIKLGIAGGGQLARMMLSTCINWDCQVRILDSEDCVCKPFCEDLFVGDFRNSSDLLSAFEHFDVVTLDLESVNIDGLKLLESRGVRVAPSSSVLEIIQNKINQKKFFRDHEIATSSFKVVNKLDNSVPHGFLKAPVGGYDGKGVLNWKGELSEVPEIFLNNVLWEEAIEIEKEISIIGVRGVGGEVLLYEATEMVFDHDLNLISHTIFPTSLTQEQGLKAQELAFKVIDSLKPVGVLAIEMFLTKKGEILVNELAPRPHNSGHHTIESCETSQFENHLRAVLGLPLGSCATLSSASTLNIIGSGNGRAEWIGVEELLSMKNVFLHNYGKISCRVGRKMGHITVTGKQNKDIQAKLELIKNIVKVKGVSDD